MQLRDVELVWFKRSPTLKWWGRVQNGNQMKKWRHATSLARVQSADLHISTSLLCRWLPKVDGKNKSSCVRQLFQSHCSPDQWFATSTSICFPTPFHLDVDGGLRFMTLCVRVCVCVCLSKGRLVYVFLLWKAISQVELINQGGGWEQTQTRAFSPSSYLSLVCASPRMLYFLCSSMTRSNSLMASCFVLVVGLDHRAPHWKWRAI